MIRLPPVQLRQVGAEIIADNPRQGAAAGPHNSPTANGDVSGEAEERGGLALIATLRAEIAASYRSFDAIVRRLGYNKSWPK
jgi:hypothetical protein